LLCFANRKYEEVKPPAVEEFCYIADHTYSKEEVVLVFCVLLLLLLFLVLGFADFCNFLVVKVLNMEADVLMALKFELGAPTVRTFLRCVYLLILWPCSIDLSCFCCFLLACWFTLFALRWCRRFCGVGQEGVDVS